MKRFFSIAIVAIMVLGLTACACSKKTNNEIAKEAKLLDWDKVASELSSNGSKAGDYNDQWFIYSGIVTNIQSTSCYMFTRAADNGSPINPITVYLNTEELKSLENGQTLCVVGKFNYSKPFASLSEAFVFPKELYDDEGFQVELLSTKEVGYTPHYFSEYEFDANGNVTKYSETSYSNTSSGKYTITQKNIDKYSLEYDNKNRIIKKEINKFVDIGNGEERDEVNGSVTVYTYNEDDSIATETKTSPGVKYEQLSQYSYEKGADGKIIKGTKTTTIGDRVNETTYEFDSNGNIIKESGAFNTSKSYQYEGDRIISKTGTGIKETKYYYGVVGTK